MNEKIPHWPVNQNAELEKYYVFCTSETVFLQWNGLKSDLKHLLKHKFRREGANFSKTKPIY